MTSEMFGPYRLEALIGRGGMGEVFRAYDTTRQRTVALKRLPAGLARDGEFQERFRREAQLVARLRDGHVIPIHDFGEIDGQLFIDMRLVDGADLTTMLGWTGPLPPERAVRIAGQVARALDAAHADGLVHRDVKPSNILLSGATPDRSADVDDYAYLVDFGIVASAEGTAGGRLTATGAAIGTAEYMAPERFVHGTGDRRVDVYALGCVLHEMLTGARPFSGTGAAAQMWAHLNAPLPRPSQVRSGIPAALDDVVAAALAKDPDQRIGSAGELAARARAALTAGGRAAAPFVAPDTAAIPPRTGLAQERPGANHQAGARSAAGPQPTALGGPPSQDAGRPPYGADPTGFGPAADRPAATGLGGHASPGHPAQGHPAQGRPGPGGRPGSDPGGQGGRGDATAFASGPPPVRPGVAAQTALGSPDLPPRRARRWPLIAAIAAVAVVALVVGVVYAVTRTSDGTSTAAAPSAEPSTSAETPVAADAAGQELFTRLGSIASTCEQPYPGDAPILSQTVCGEWVYDLYPDADSARAAVRDGYAGIDAPGDPCYNPPAIDVSIYQTWSGSNGRSGGLGCSGYAEGFTVAFSVDGIPVVATRSADSSVDYAGVLEEASLLSGEFQ